MDVCQTQLYRMTKKTTQCRLLRAALAFPAHCVTLPFLLVPFTATLAAFQMCAQFSTGCENQAQLPSADVPGDESILCWTVQGRKTALFCLLSINHGHMGFLQAGKCAH